MTDQLIQNPEYYRPCVGMMIINDAHKIFIARRKDLDDDAMYAWQMPQGGIDDGETPQQAVMREMIEEIGTNAVALMSESREWIYYDFPDWLKNKSRGNYYMGQKQRWFLFKFVGHEADINLKTKHREFSQWQWAEKEEVMRQVVPFKLRAYEKVFEEFSQMLNPENTKAEI